MRSRAWFRGRPRFRVTAGVLAVAAVVAVLLWGPLRLIEPLRSLADGQALDRLTEQLRGYWPWTPLVSMLLLA